MAVQDKGTLETNTQNTIFENTSGQIDAGDHQTLLLNLIDTLWGRWETDSTAKTGTYTLTDDDFVVLADTSGGAFTITLPAAASAGAGRVYIVIKSSGSANAVTLNGDAAETINGSTTVSTATQYGAIIALCTGAEWFAWEPAVSS